MVFNREARIRPTVEDVLRGISYSALLVWTIMFLVFLVFPPVSYVGTLDTASRFFWMLTCAGGAFMAALGAFTRVDLKLELPGLVFMGIGPLFYMAANAYYVCNPPPPTFDGVSRIALTVFAIVPLLMSLPRLWSLYSESQRAKNLRREMGQGGKKK